MREILFKAKDIDTGEWVEGSLAHYKESKKHFIITDNDFQWGMYGSYSYDGDFTEIDPNTLCQYTGLTDKNDNKIWENDIVMLDDEFWVVKWSDDAQFTIEDDCTIEHFGNVWGTDCEVYGNVFDNPELVKEGSE